MENSSFKKDQIFRTAKFAAANNFTNATLPNEKRRLTSYNKKFKVGIIKK